MAKKASEMACYVMKRLTAPDLDTRGPYEDRRTNSVKTTS